MRWLENMERRGKDHITKNYTVESKKVRGTPRNTGESIVIKNYKRIGTKEHGLGERIFWRFGQSISQSPECDKRARMM